MTRLPLILTGLLLWSVTGLQALAQPLPVIPPESAGMDRDLLSKVDGVILEAIEAEETPGAVLVVLRDNRIVWRKGYGNRQLRHGAEPATPETIYDMASVTKPVATATAIMQLVEQGKVRLSDPVSRYLPSFRSWPAPDGNNRTIRVVHLLTHTSGLPAYPPVAELSEAAAGGLSTVGIVENWLDSVQRDFAPGESFQYSCPNFVTLQRIVEKVSGMTLADYSRQNIFEPLRMHRTSYLPPAEWEPVTAPTGLLDSGEALVCTVHDPFARELMEGNSGNAGLFSTADDLALFAAMMLNGGEWDGTRILSPASVETMTKAPSGLESFGRGLGWDLSSAYATNQGDLFGPNTYGHTGFTGTSLIIDPDTRTSVILLSNRVYPEGGGGSVVRLRSLVANIVAASIVSEPADLISP